MIARRLRVLASAFAIFAMLFTIAGCSGTNRSLTILSVASGSISVTNIGSTAPVQAGVGTSLKPGDMVQSGDNSTAVVTFFEGSTIELKAGTRIEIVSLNAA